jgi:hypothetical protein
MPTNDIADALPISSVYRRWLQIAEAKPIGTLPAKGEGTIAQSGNHLNLGLIPDCAQAN